MAIKPSQQRAVAKYVGQHYDRIEVKPQKGTKEIWTAAAEREGKSLQKFIIEAVEAYMESLGE